jgi:hypothetical protein
MYRMPIQHFRLDAHMYFLRFETCYQIALAIKKEVEDLEAGGIQVGTFVFVSHLINSSHVKHEYM